MDVPSRDLPEGTEENHVKPRSERPVSGRDSNRSPPEYKYRALPLRYPAR
jgi:hypothetical protein